MKINSIDNLLNYLQLQPSQVNYSKKASQNFSFSASTSFIKRIKKSDPKDPLLLQILPQKDEMIEQKGFSSDPLDEQQSLISPGLLQKYQHRALLIVTPSCGIHCRYCFRRYYPYQSKSLLSTQLDKNIDIIKSKPQITEIILSGGDPLILNDHYFSELLNKLAPIKQLKRLRIHSRQLIIEPKRITQQLIDSLKEFPQPIAIVMHINHANEINTEVAESIIQLKQANIQLLNQSVLLKNINDNSEALIQLSEKLFHIGIVPYYLHMLDPVSGSQHFEVSVDKAKTIIEEMKLQLSGYLVPKLVKESAADGYKREV
jgi:EF-P beta-lysylation protein EpmB